MGGKKLVNLGAATVGTDALNRDTADARYWNLTSANILTFNNGGAGAASGTTFNGSSPTIISYNSIGAVGAASAVVTGQILTVNTDKLLLQHDGSNGFIRTQLGTLNLGAGGNNWVAIAASGSVTFGGAASGLTASPGDNSTKFSTTAYVIAALAAYAPLASPPFTGAPTAPTAAVGTNTTQIATTAFVQAARPPIGQTITSAATVTPTFNDDFIEITAQAAGLTLANPTGSAVNMWGIAVRIKDNATPQTIAFGTQYRGVGVTLPTTTVSGKTLVLGMIFNNALTKWDVVSVAQE